MKRKAIQRRLEDINQVDGQDLECHIKRVKISYTPGELRLVVIHFIDANFVLHTLQFAYRLQNDLKGIKELIDISVELTETPSCAIISFKIPVPGMPSRFLIQVPKFYPHNPPLIKLCDPAFHGLSIYWDGTGKVVHDDLTSNWTAMSSLLNVIDILRNIRSSIAEEKTINRTVSYSFDGVMDIS